MGNLNKNEILEGVQAIINDSLNTDNNFDGTSKFNVRRYVNNLIEEGHRDPDLMSYLLKYDNILSQGTKDFMIYEQFGQGLVKFAHNKAVKNTINEMNTVLKENGRALAAYKLIENIHDDILRDDILEAFNNYVFNRTEETKDALIESLEPLIILSDPIAIQLNLMITEDSKVNAKLIDMNYYKDTEQKALQEKLEEHRTQKKMNKLYEKVQDYIDKKFAEDEAAELAEQDQYCLNAIANNQGLNLLEHINNIRKTDASSNEKLSEVLEMFADAINQGAYEERLYENFIYNISKYDYLIPVSKEIKSINEKASEKHEEITLTKILEEMKDTYASSIYVELIQEDVARYVKDPSPINRVQLRNALMPYASDPLINEMFKVIYSDNTRNVNELSEKVLNIKDRINIIRENASISNLYTPVQYVCENESVFNVNGQFYVKKGNNIALLDDKYVDKLNENFIDLCRLVNDPHVSIADDYIILNGNELTATIYEGYVDIHGHKESKESLRNLNEMCMKYDNYDTNFYIMCSCLLENFNNIAKIDWAKHVTLNENASVSADIFKLDHHIFMVTHNDASGQHTFYRNINPIFCKNKLNEHMGINVSSLFADLLPSQDKIILKLNETKNSYEDSIEQYEDMIDKLKEALKNASEENKDKLEKAIEDAEEKLKDVKDEYVEWQKQVDDATGEGDETEDSEEDGTTVTEKPNEPIDDDEVEDAESELTQPLSDEDGEVENTDSFEDDENDEGISDQDFASFLGDTNTEDEEDEDDETDDEADDDTLTTFDSDDDVTAANISDDETEDSDEDSEDSDVSLFTDNDTNTADDEDIFVSDDEADDEVTDDSEDNEFATSELDDETEDNSDEEGSEAFTTDDSDEEDSEAFETPDEEDELQTSDSLLGDDETDDESDDEEDSEAFTTDDTDEESVADDTDDAESFTTDDEVTGDEGEDATDLFGGNTEDPLGTNNDIVDIPDNAPKTADDVQYQPNYSYKIADVMFDENVKENKKEKSGSVIVIVPMIDGTGKKFIENKTINFYLDDNNNPILDNEPMTNELYAAVIDSIKSHPDYKSVCDTAEPANEQIGATIAPLKSDEDEDEDWEAQYLRDGNDEDRGIFGNDEDEDDDWDSSSEDDNDEPAGNIFNFNLDDDDSDETDDDSDETDDVIPTYKSDNTEIEFPAATSDDTAIPESKQVKKNKKSINEKKSIKITPVFKTKSGRSFFLNEATIKASEEQNQGVATPLVEVIDGSDNATSLESGSTGNEPIENYNDSKETQLLNKLRAKALTSSENANKAGNVVNIGDIKKYGNNDNTVYYFVIDNNGTAFNVYLIAKDVYYRDNKEFDYIISPDIQQVNAADNIKLLKCQLNSDEALTCYPSSNEADCLFLISSIFSSLTGDSFDNEKPVEVTAEVVDENCKIRKSTKIDADNDLNNSKAANDAKYGTKEENDFAQEIEDKLKKDGTVGALDPQQENESLNPNQLINSLLLESSNIEYEVNDKVIYKGETWDVFSVINQADGSQILKLTKAGAVMDVTSKEVKPDPSQLKDIDPNIPNQFDFDKNNLTTTIKNEKPVKMADLNEYMVPCIIVNGKGQQLGTLKGSYCKASLKDILEGIDDVRIQWGDDDDPLRSQSVINKDSIVINKEDWIPAVIATEDDDPVRKIKVDPNSYVNAKEDEDLVDCTIADKLTQLPKKVIRILV